MVSISTLVEEYTSNDKWSIENDWQPTGTFYVDPVETKKKEDAEK